MLRRFRADKGSAGLQFAMIAPVYLLLLMGTIEAGVIFFAQCALQNAVNDTARLVRTGQSACYSLNSHGICQTMTADQFRAKICSEVSALLQNCSTDANGNTDLQFDVTDYPAGFTGVTNSSPLTPAKTLPALTTFNTRQRLRCGAGAGLLSLAGLHPDAELLFGQYARQLSSAGDGSGVSQRAV
jgi:Flp pilus assembly protein TadG